MKRIVDLEEELIHFGLLDKAREIYSELGAQAGLSYIRSSYHLLSKVYHPDLNPQNSEKAKVLQQRLNNLKQLLNQTPDEEIIRVIRKGIPTRTSEKKKILVVEDEFGMQEIIRDILIMEGYQVEVAVDGEEGLKIYGDFKADLLLTDVVMPKMNGLELVRNIRKIDPNIKVIYTSGFFGIKKLKRELHQELLQNDYRTLSKPFKVSVMLEMVDNYLNDTDTVRA